MKIVFSCIIYICSSNQVLYEVICIYIYIYYKKVMNNLEWGVGGGVGREASKGASDEGDGGRRE